MGREGEEAGMKAIDGADLEAVTQLAAELVAMPTVSADGNLEFIAHCANRLESAGARVSVGFDGSGRKANLFASLGPEDDGGLAFAGHADVVPADEDGWTTGPFEPVVRDGRLYGRGSCDMKGFIAAAMAALAAAPADRLVRPLHIALTYDEEVGCHGARQLVEHLLEHGPRPSAFIVGEPTGMRPVVAHKGCMEYTTHFSGTAGHASRPDLGVNAVEFAARYMTRLMEIAEALKARAPAQSPFLPPHSTLQVGVCRGGSARNVIAHACEVEWEVRPVNAADAAYVLETIDAFARDVLLPEMRRGAPEATVWREVIGEVAGLQPVEGAEAVALVASLLKTEAREVVAFGTEAGLYQSLPASAVVCGPGSILQAHQPDEFVAVDALATAGGMLRAATARCLPG